jgi:uncharacterized SAM-binding protein YcdF (DUF218 family)
VIFVNSILRFDDEILGALRARARERARARIVVHHNFVDYTRDRQPMLDPILLKAIAKSLVLPPTGLLLVAVLGLALWSRFPRAGITLVTAAVATLLAISTPVVADSIVRLVDDSRPFSVADARDAKAIVILGGGIRPDAPEYGGDTLARLTLERVRYGARVARLTGLPVLVSGGAVLGGEPEALLMRDALENEFGVPVRWVETASRTTHENAVRTAEILRSEGIGRVVLVAHGFDMRRATAEFAAQGIETVPAATGISGSEGYSIRDFLPSMQGLDRSYFGLYEILANIVRITSGG